MSFLSLISFRVRMDNINKLDIMVLSGNEPYPPIVAEEKIVFGLNAKAVSYLTLAKIRKLYSRADNKAIAKQVPVNRCLTKFIFPNYSDFPYFLPI